MKNKGLGLFERYLSIWVVLCIFAGIFIGKIFPSIPNLLGKAGYANVSIPIAILICLMIYPMMLKIDFQSIKNVGKRPKGLFITCVVNWLIKPFTMFGISWLFFMWYLRRGYLKHWQENTLLVLFCWGLPPVRRWCLYGAT